VPEQLHQSNADHSVRQHWCKPSNKRERYDHALVRV
jgi:hypothetical protein